jgi:hypothetical protein
VIPLLVDALAVHRLTRLVTRDVLTRGWREKVIERAYTRRGGHSAWYRGEDGIMVLHGAGTPQMVADRWDEVPATDDDPPKLATLVTCGWCASAWIALGAVFARRRFPRLWGPLAEALAFSAVAGLVSGLEEDWVGATTDLWEDHWVRYGDDPNEDYWPDDPDFEAMREVESLDREFERGRYR